MSRAGAWTLRGASILALGAVAPSPGTAQYLEPHTRTPAVSPPVFAEPLDEVLARAGGAAPRREGTFPVLVVPALFEDSPEPHVDPAEVAGILFGTSGRTLRTYYDEVSGGRLSVEGVVTDWVRTSVPVAQGAGVLDGHGWIGPRADEHLAAAVAAVDPSIDFGAFDNDGPDGIPDSGDDDGWVDGIAFLNIEAAGSCGGAGFWPHLSGLQAPDGSFGVATDDVGASGNPILVGLYFTDSAVDCGGVHPQGPHVFAHEFGHVLGLPDFYRAVEGIEPWQRHWAIGCFGLMGGGTWGCGTGPKAESFGPPHLSPLPKLWLGWLDVEQVGVVTNREYALGPVQTSGQALAVPLSPGSAEYFLIEYRPRLGFDDILPDDGVLVYHVDEGPVVLQEPSQPTLYGYHLVEADGDGALRKVERLGGNRGVAEDMFARNGAVDSITRTTVPSTAHHGGQPSTLRIHALRVEDGVARIRLSTTTPLTAAALSAPPGARALDSWEARWRVSGGTPPYDVVTPAGYFPPGGLTMALENGDEVVVRGTPMTAGLFGLPLSVVDAAGDVWWYIHPLAVDDAVLTEDDLMEGLAAPAAVDPRRLDYLDRSGNGSGSFDVGDLRAYLQRTGGA